MVRPRDRVPAVDSGVGQPQGVSWGTCSGVEPTPTTTTGPTQAGGGAVAGVLDGEIETRGGAQGGDQAGIVDIQQQEQRPLQVGVVPVPAAQEPGLLQGLGEREGDKPCYMYI